MSELQCVQRKPEMGLFQVHLEYARAEPSINPAIVFCGRGRGPSGG